VDKRCRDAVLYCKAQADYLKLNEYPLYSNISVFFYSAVFPFRKVALRLSQFLDKLITLPSIQSHEPFMKLRVLLAQGESHEAFKSSMHELDVSLKCNAIWENDSVAYRCNTCALTPCMSLCASCFQAANHEGHDFTRFFSREGGACDCGNADVIRPMGFCPRHGENAVRPPSPSPLIVSLPRHIFLKLIVCLFLEWRGYVMNFSAGIATHEQFSFYSKNFVFDLMLTCRRKNTIIISFEECVNYGGPMRQAMAEILMDRELYLALTERNSDDHWKTRQKFYDDRMTIFSESMFYRCECLLDELLFWVTRMNFPQNLINFSLSMLSEPNYTDALSTRFFTWYPLVANCVRKLCLYQQLRQRNSDVIQSTCSRLIHISVQMLSSEVLCRKLNSKCDLVSVVLNTACYLFNEYLEKSEMTLGKGRSLYPFFIWCTTGKQLEGNRSDWDVMVIEKNAVRSYYFG
uniref:E3 ubiquitin-protein ligase n=1 Tax=Angiostrongylus cantonensis TaxID=6313 RepID=A0A0K0DP88_ANGCA